MKSVPVQKAVGMVLCHDVTRIIPGEFKGRAFRKGHIIREQDVPELLKIGKEHIYVFDLKAGWVHEDTAAERIAGAAAGPGLSLTPPSEGRVNLTADIDGLLKVNVEALYRINEIEAVVFSTLHTNRTIRKKRAVAGTRIIPLVTAEEKIQRVERICRDHFPVVQISPLTSVNVGVITTGSEIYHGRIQDRFGPILHRKFHDLGSRILDQVFVSDDIRMTVEAIHRMLRRGAGLIAVTGGMSVDPDDQTPAAIRAAGGEVITYGAPTFPGAMFMLAYVGGIPVLGLPGCVMYHQASVFDLIVPRILAGEKLTRADIISLGHGGFCSDCPECRYPGCGFGKGC
ncbi:MAG: molybdopterin-binding protein [Desulfococcaceae bacterium]